MAINHRPSSPNILFRLSLFTVAVCLASPSCSADPDPLRLLGEETQGPRRLPADSKNDTPVYGYRVVQAYPHDSSAYTQGLVFADGILYESTGGSRWSRAILGYSTLRKVELETGRVIEMKPLAPEFFGEGIAVFEERIIQLTWQSRVGFVYDKASFNVLRLFKYANEGWGMTHDGEKLIVSDGTSILRFWDPESMAETRQVEVRENGRPVIWLNELEYIKGEIFANVWQSERIARIAPKTGEVTGWIDLTGILNAVERVRGVDVLNGIAYDVEGDRLFVTGKGWPKLFEIELVPPK